MMFIYFYYFEHKNYFYIALSVAQKMVGIRLFLKFLNNSFIIKLFNNLFDYYLNQ